MNEQEVQEKVDMLIEEMTPENIAALSDDDLERLMDLLDKVEEILEG